MKYILVVSGYACMSVIEFNNETACRQAAGKLSQVPEYEITFFPKGEEEVKFREEDKFEL